VLDAHAPLVCEGFAVDEDQGGGATLGDHGAAHDGLAGSGWGDEQPVIVGEEGSDRGALLGAEFGGERDVDLLAGFRTSVTDSREPACSTMEAMLWRNPRGRTRRSSGVRS
jgi:hypothetical protein